jgi:hypothetical protein
MWSCQTKSVLGLFIMNTEIERYIFSMGHTSLIDQTLRVRVVHVADAPEVPVLGAVIFQVLLKTRRNVTSENRSFSSTIILILIPLSVI